VFPIHRGSVHATDCTPVHVYSWASRSPCANKPLLNGGYGLGRHGYSRPNPNHRDPTASTMVACTYQFVCLPTYCTEELAIVQRMMRHAWPRTFVCFWFSKHEPPRFFLYFSQPKLQLFYILSNRKCGQKSDVNSNVKNGQTDGQTDGQDLL